MSQFLVPNQSSVDTLEIQDAKLIPCTVKSRYVDLVFSDDWKLIPLVSFEHISASTTVANFLCDSTSFACCTLLWRNRHQHQMYSHCVCQCKWPIKTLHDSSVSSRHFVPSDHRYSDTLLVVKWRGCMYHTQAWIISFEMGVLLSLSKVGKLYPTDGMENEFNYIAWL